MAPIIVNREKHSEKVVSLALNKLSKLQKEVVSEIKTSLSSLYDIEHLYETRDYIDELILNFEPEEIDLDDYEEDE